MDNKDLLGAADWLPSEAWAEFVKMRKSIKKPMTAYAEKLMLKRLAAFVADGQDAQAMLDQSIVNCWQNIYEVKAEDPARGVAPFRGKPQLALVDQQAANTAAARQALFGSKFDEERTIDERR